MKKTYIIPFEKCVEVDMQGMIAQSETIDKPGTGEADPDVDQDVKEQRGGLWGNEW